MLSKLTKIITILFLTSCSLVVFSKTTNVQSIDQLINKFIRAYENRNAKEIAQLYAPNALVIGTGRDETLIGRKAIETAMNRDFEQSTKATIALKKIASSIQNNFAVVAYDTTVNVTIPESKPFKSTLRFTLTLSKNHEQWQIIQSHLSAPLAEEKLGHSFPQS